ncbi:MAG: hypothetical protein A3J62_00830 [Candidatus Buchananbacteria bacterium RIFCSPHIGHO2_02_FULL_38_8]|uniref:CYTH domain-containing protein n=1 Tax=Candidatus Buchananbacteria bacterium RIFCSPHIGHO2_02_FULL_38_8 TaxID=1797538 RepID=A0A1G1Y7M7_9BACT|nr:MAG: hypothetical protein A3J62_00830 [Candidatus Buchananbacteria bacterium RIFCSPHIGHO2_02_FULL_38_8]
MTTGDTRLEIETKIPLLDLDPGSLADRITELGGIAKKPWHLRDGTLFDTPDQQLFRAGKLLRLGVANGIVSVTAKKRVAIEDGILIREEQYFTVESSASTVAEVLKMLGYSPFFRYQKLAVTFVLPDQTKVAIDQTALGNFVEIEVLSTSLVMPAIKVRIIEVTQFLGLNPADFISQSYLELQIAKCAKRGVPLEDCLLPKS